MNNLKAKVEHFDQRSEEEARNKREKMKTDRALNGDDDNDDDKNDSSSSDSSSSNDNAYDFDF
jgi:hypothetical protein